MDGPNPNWAFFRELRNCRGENDMTKFFPAGSCGIQNGENDKKLLKALKLYFA